MTNAPNEKLVESEMTDNQVKYLYSHCMHRNCASLH